MTCRAVIFVDGSNWYHSLKEAGITGVGQLNYAKISRKLVGPSRQWIGTRYYIGRVNQNEAARLYAEQRQFLAHLSATDPRISHHLGRLETRHYTNDVAVELKQYLAGLRTRIDIGVYQYLQTLANRHVRVPVTTEKAVDVKLAVDMVIMAERGEYDAGYLLSADGDYTPAVEAVCSLKKPIYVASPATGAQLAQVATSFIKLRREWFSDCW